MKASFVISSESDKSFQQHNFLAIRQKATLITLSAWDGFLYNHYIANCRIEIISLAVKIFVRLSPQLRWAELIEAIEVQRKGLVPNSRIICLTFSIGRNYVVHK